MTSDEVTRKILELPITRQTARELRAGDLLSLRGVIYTARDAAHKRMTETSPRITIPIVMQKESGGGVPYQVVTIEK